MSDQEGSHNDREKLTSRNTPNEEKNHLTHQESFTLYVNGLPLGFKDEDLRMLFDGVGVIQRAQVIMDPHSGNNRGFGFISFSDEALANKAIVEVNDKEVLGRRVRVEHARRARPRSPTPGEYYGPSYAGNRGKERDGSSRGRGSRRNDYRNSHRGRSRSRSRSRSPHRSDRLYRGSGGYDHGNNYYRQHDKYVSSRYAPESSRYTSPAIPPPPPYYPAEHSTMDYGRSASYDEPHRGPSSYYASIPLATTAQHYDPYSLPPAAAPSQYSRSYPPPPLNYEQRRYPPPAPAFPPRARSPYHP